MIYLSYIWGEEIVKMYVCANHFEQWRKSLLIFSFFLLIFCMFDDKSFFYWHILLQIFVSNLFKISEFLIYCGRRCFLYLFKFSPALGAVLLPFSNEVSDVIHECLHFPSSSFLALHLMIWKLRRRGIQVEQN